ncbi:MFS transporter [Halobacillus kuroshimensis]|uniref:MFS transporter n=1 Tax=Halobacillus kuroshimensis TaxID=302481 RepID=UPI00040D46A3|nr:MFS transporter [Halobacillus kuroshimensis]
MKKQRSSTDSSSTNKKMVVLTCTLLAFAVMNGTMFNVALPDIAADFHISTAEVSWVVTSFIIVFALGTLVYGKLADLYSIRSLYTAGITFFSLGALLGVFSTNMVTLIFARILQAIGASSIPSLSFIIPARFFPEERGRMFGYLASTIAFASGIGPLVGGVIGGVFHWRYIFLVSVIPILFIPLFRKWLPYELKKEGRVDIVGAVLVGIVVTGLLFFITNSNWILLVTAFACFPILVSRMKRIDQPFIDPAILTIRPYALIMLVSFTTTTIIMGITFLIPLMLRDLYGLSTLSIGLVLFPGAFISGILGKWTGEMISHRGGAPVFKLGILIMVLGTFLLCITSGNGIVLLSFGLFTAYLSFPLLQSSTADLISTYLSEEQNGTGFGLFHLSNFLAGAFSSALFGRLLQAEYVSFQRNPFSATGEGLIYSQLFLGCMILALCSYYTFKTKLQKEKTIPGRSSHSL